MADQRQRVRYRTTVRSSNPKPIFCQNQSKEVPFALSRFGGMTLFWELTVLPHVAVTIHIMAKVRSSEVTTSPGISTGENQLSHQVRRADRQSSWLRWWTKPDVFSLPELTKHSIMYTQLGLSIWWHLFLRWTSLFVWLCWTLHHWPTAKCPDL